MIAETLIETFTECINRAIWEKEQQGLKPVRVECSVLMCELLRDLYPLALLSHLYGLPLRTNPQLQGISLIVRTEEDA